MHRTIPKHKGTEHLRAEIKTRIKELKDELAGPSKGGDRGGPPTFIHPEGAAQVAILGPPNTGKSSLHVALTGSHAHIGAYPFTTQHPEPGMLPVNDAAIQLVDLPPISRHHPIPWIGNTLQSADGALFVVDLGQPGCVEQILEAREILAERRVTLTGSWDGEPASGDDPFAIRLPTLLVANKADAIPDIDGDLAVCRELGDLHFPTVTVAAATVTVGKCRSPSSRQTARSPSMSGMASALFATSSVGRRIANGSSPDAGSPSHEPVSVTPVSY